MAYNIPGIFKMVQGVPPRTPRYGPAPSAPAGTHVMPDGSVMSNAAMGFTGGGTYNIPGYDGREIMTADEWVNAPPGSPGSMDGGGGDTVTGESIYIRHLADAYGMTVEEAAAQWEDMSPDQRQVVIDSYMGKEDESGGGGSGLAGTYAQIAENARQFNEQMAFERERAQQEDRVARWGAELQKQQAMQDFYAARDAAKIARKQVFNDAASGALAAQSAAIGTANIPGIENFRLDGSMGNPLADAPIIRTDPSLAYGHQLSEPADLPEPNIPGVNF